MNTKELIKLVEKINKKMELSWIVYNDCKTLIEHEADPDELHKWQYIQNVNFGEINAYSRVKEMIGELIKENTHE